MVSGGHEELTTPEAIEAARALDRAWTDPEIARAQRELADGELARWRRGEDVAPFVAYTALLKLYAWNETTLLEVGCGAGYNSEMLRAKGWAGIYHGVDFSAEMVRLAREANAHDGATSFEVGDARALTHGDDSYPIVVSGSCLESIAMPFGWQKALRESARVSSRFVLIHKIPLIAGPTRQFTKTAYEVPVFESWFGEEEFRREIADAGLRWIDERVVSTMPDGRWTSIMCRKEGT